MGWDFLKGEEIFNLWWFQLVFTAFRGSNLCFDIYFRTSTLVYKTVSIFNLKEAEEDEADEEDEEGGEGEQGEQGEQFEECEEDGGRRRK